VVKVALKAGIIAGMAVFVIQAIILVTGLYSGVMLATKKWQAEPNAILPVACAGCCLMQAVPFVAYVGAGVLAVRKLPACEISTVAGSGAIAGAVAGIISGTAYAILNSLDMITFTLLDPSEFAGSTLLLVSANFCGTSIVAAVLGAIGAAVFARWGRRA
jgi:hypothetical protein